jgi:ApaG protein
MTSRAHRKIAGSGRIISASKITDGRGGVNHVDGDGVVGEQPLLKPGDSHDYVSGCPLATPSGVMEGHYRFIRADGSTFLVEIPRFKLVAPATAR